MRINKTFVDKVKIPAPTSEGKPTSDIYRDKDLVGFALRVFSGGTKTFIVEKRVNGKVRRAKLGRYPTLTAEVARSDALTTLGKMAKGKDPVTEKRVEAACAITLEEVFEDYLKSHRDLRPRTIKDYNQIMDEAFSDWRAKPITKITKDMVERRHRERGFRSPARANNAMRVLRALINHAMAKYEDAEGNPIIMQNPVIRLNQTRAWYQVDRKQRWVKPHQLPIWYQATLKLNLELSRDYMHLLLFTGLRKGEALGLRWEDVDFKDRTLTVRETKNRRTHVLPLSDFLYTLLKRRAEYRMNEYVFPSNHPRGHLIEPKSAMQRVVELSGIQFSFHDLRRTFITIAESLDISVYALKRLLNHKDPGDVTAGYIIMDIERLRDPMQRITDKIQAFIQMDNEEKVVELNADKK